MERRAKLAIPQLPSTFSADVAAITGAICETPDIHCSPLLGVPQACSPAITVKGSKLQASKACHRLKLLVNGAGSPGTSAGSSASEQSRFGVDEADGLASTPESRWPWPKKLSQLLSACSGSLGAPSMLQNFFRTLVHSSSCLCSRAPCTTSKEQLAHSYLVLTPLVLYETIA